MPKLPLSRRASLTLIACAAAVAAGVVVAPVGASAAVSYVVLAHNNYATWQTNISNSAGTPLGLTAKSGYPPLWVNNSKVVARLNADYVDGLHASAFARSSGKTGIIVSTTVATCPKGTVLTGGGGWGGAPLDYSGPYPTFASDGTSVNGFVPNTWIAASFDSGTVYSYAICYSASGAAIPGAGVVPAGALKSAGPLAKLAAKLAAR